MEYAVVTAPAAPVRIKPFHRREMVNQLLFGESVRVLKSKNSGWVKIRSLHDRYEGWMSASMLEETDKATAITPARHITTDMLGMIQAGDKKIHIPVGSGLPFFENGKGRIGSMEYSYSGQYFSREDQQPDKGLIEQLSLAWLEVPYLWGGRTPLGVDCSGFIQVIFKLIGIDLPRDAWQQAQEGKEVKKFSLIQPGDLAFFDDREEIVHTGILLGKDRLIHASGKVRVDTMNRKGIVNPPARKRPLRLQAIRRVG